MASIESSAVVSNSTKLAIRPILAVLKVFAPNFIHICIVRGGVLAFFCWLTSISEVRRYTTPLGINSK